MTIRARDVMTPDPTRCTKLTTIDEIARLMISSDCGEIPVVDSSDQVVGVVTDRDIVCRIVAEQKNPVGYTAESCMSQPVVTVDEEAPLPRVVALMEEHQIRRVPVVRADGGCSGIIAQADIARAESPRAVAEFVREVSQETGRPSR